MASRDFLQRIELSSNERDAFQGIQDYLNESKHGSLQKRTYRKSAEFDFYDVCAEELDLSFDSTVSFYRCGPLARDFYFNINKQSNKYFFQIFKSSESPDDFIDVIKERVLYLGETAWERLGTINNSHPVSTPFGYSLWSGNVGPKTLLNFNSSIDDEVFTEDFKDYCTDGRKFCLKFREPEL